MRFLIQLLCLVCCSALSLQAQTLFYNSTNVTIQANALLNTGNLQNSGTSGRINNNGQVWVQQNATNATVSVMQGSGLYIATGASISTWNFQTTTIPTLTLNKAAGMTLASSIEVVSGLTFQNGILTTATNRVIIATSGTITGASSTRYVQGTLQRNVGTGNLTRQFPIGTSTGYFPIEATFANITQAGGASFGVTAGDHPQIAAAGLNAARSVNAYWTFETQSLLGTTANVELQFPGAALDGGTDFNLLQAKQLRNGTWHDVTVIARSGTSITLTLAAAGEIVIGTPPSPVITSLTPSSTSATPAAVTLTIDGTGLSLPTSLLISQMNASSQTIATLQLVGNITSSSATQVVVTVPANALLTTGNYSVTLANAGGTTTAVLTITPAAPPVQTAPTQLTRYGFDVNWNLTIAQGYIVEVSATTTFTVIASTHTVGASVTSQTISGLNQQGTYYSRVVATDGGSLRIGTSNTFEIRTMKVATSEYFTYTPSVFNFGPFRFRVVWQDAGNELEYHLQIFTNQNDPEGSLVPNVNVPFNDGDGNPQVGIQLAANTTSYTVNGLPTSQPYFFRVRARFNPWGEWSNIIPVINYQITQSLTDGFETIFYDNPSSVRHGQSFTTEAAGLLTTVEVFRGSFFNAVPNVTLRVFSGSTTNIGSVLYTQNNITISAATNTWATIHLNTPVMLNATTQYTFDLEAPNAGVGEFSVLKKSDTNPYSGGVFFSDALPTPTQDLTFRVTIVDPATITTAIPSVIVARTDALTVTFAGGAFIQTTASIAVLNNSGATTGSFSVTPFITSSSATQVAINIPAGYLATAGTISVTLGGYLGNATTTLTISPAAPQIVSLSTNSTVASMSGLSVTIAGSGYAGLGVNTVVTLSTLSVSGASIGAVTLATTVINATGLQVAIPAGAVSTSGTLLLTISNGTGSPTTATFTVLPAAPSITNLTPNTTVASLNSMAITLHGASYSGTIAPTVTLAVVNVSGVTIGSITLASTVVDNNQLTAVVPSGFVATTGTMRLTVSNSAGSATTTLTVTPTTPTVTNLTPNTTIASVNTMSVTVNGFGYAGTVSPSVTMAVLNVSGVTVGNITLATTIVDNNQLTAVIPSGFVATTGTMRLTVSNSAGSSVTTFTVTPVTPTITNLTPNTTTASANAMSVTVNGFGYAGTVSPTVTLAVLNVSGVTIGSVTLASSVVSGTELTATVPAGAVSTAGTLTLTVSNNTGSATTTLTVTPIAPTVTSLTPNSTAASLNSMQITFAGAGYSGATAPVVTMAVLSASGVTVGSVTLASTPINGTMTAIIPAGLVSTSGTVRLTVTNTAGSTTTIFTVTPTTPTITNVTPNTTIASMNAMSITVNGFGYSGVTAPTVTLAVLNVSGVTVGSLTLSSSVVSNGELTATIPAGFISTAGNVRVSVSNSAGLSSTTLTVNPIAPTITNLTPNTTVASANAMSVTITGAGYSGAFAPTVTLAVLNVSGVTVGSVTLASSVVSGTELTATVPAGAVSTAGTLTLMVSNNTGSATTTLTVTPIAPTVTSLTPNSTAASLNSMQITFAGAGYSGATAPVVTMAVLSASGVTVGSVTLASTPINGTMTAIIPAGLVSTSGTVRLTVTNTAGSTTTIFTVTPTTPTITNVTPNTTIASMNAMSITVNGFGYSGVTAPTVTLAVLNVSGVTVGSLTLSSSVVSNGELTATIPAGFISTAGNVRVSVSNSAGLSSTTLTVNPIAPTITNLTPNTTVASANAFIVSINGAGYSGAFAPTVTLAVLNVSGVTIGSVTLASSVVSGTELTATVPAGAVSTSGTLRLTVSNNTGSATTTLTVTPAVPTLVSISPTSTSASNNPMTITITGTNYAGASAPTVTLSALNSSGVTVGTITLSGTVNSNTQMVVNVPSGAVATAGTLTLNLTTGGGSTSAIFTVIPVPFITSLSPTSLPTTASATVLTINGIDLLNATTLTITRLNANGSVAGVTSILSAVTSATASQISVLLPAGTLATAGTLTVTFQNNGGITTATLATVKVPRFLVVAPPTTLASLNAMQVTLSGDNLENPTVLNITQINGQGAVTGLTNLLGGVQSSSTTAVTVVLPAGSVATGGTLTFSLTNSFGTTTAEIYVQSQSVIVTNANNDGGGSLRRAFLLTATGGTIQIQGSIPPVTLTDGPIEVTKEVNLIDNNGGLQINGSGAPIFDVQCGGNLYLENVILTGSGNQPAIRNDCGTVRMRRVRANGN